MYNPILMRRISASAFLFVLFVGLMAPLLAVGPRGVPACCRRDGKHHCNMAATGDGFRASPAACPYGSSAVLLSPVAEFKESIFRAPLRTPARVAPLLRAFGIVQPARETARLRGPPTT